MKHKRTKKAVAWSVYQRRDLKLADAIHVTSRVEADECTSLFRSMPIFFIPNGVDETDLVVQRRPMTQPATGKRIAMFLGRLYPVKGIPILLQAWARLRPSDWVLHIVGPDESGHRRELEHLIRRLDLSTDVLFFESVSGAQKEKMLAEAELMILPSLSESFGLVVAEALEAGVPVLTTTAAPWSDVMKEKCGWSVPPTVDGLFDGLRAATALGYNDLREMGVRGHMYINREFRWPGIARKFLDLYETVIEAKYGSSVRNQ